MDWFELNMEEGEYTASGSDETITEFGELATLFDFFNPDREMVSTRSQLGNFRKKGKVCAEVVIYRKYITSDMADKIIPGAKLVIPVNMNQAFPVVANDEIRGTVRILEFLGTYAGKVETWENKPVVNDPRESDLLLRVIIGKCFQENNPDYPDLIRAGSILYMEETANGSCLVEFSGNSWTADIYAGPKNTEIRIVSCTNTANYIKSVRQPAPVANQIRDILYKWKELIPDLAIRLQRDKSSDHDTAKLITEMVNYSIVARDNGIIGLEAYLDAIPEGFLKSAIDALMHNKDPENIDTLLLNAIAGNQSNIPLAEYLLITEGINAIQNGSGIEMFINLLTTFSEELAKYRKIKE